VGLALDKVFWINRLTHPIVEGQWLIVPWAWPENIQSFQVWVGVGYRSIDERSVNACITVQLMTYFYHKLSFSTFFDTSFVQHNRLIF
jgi:hypothetical protein